MELVKTAEDQLEAGHGHGIKLEWKDIRYSVSQKETPHELKTILHSISGEALPGELMGIMGTSGAGKSTLLDVLSGRIESKNLSGVITTNGSPIDMKAFRRMTGYVMQSDALYPLLTVKETIRFAAYLRISDKSRAEKNVAADEIITLLRLENCADTVIGNDNVRGLSGGEKRRVSIAVDVVHQPAVIFLDEPTSGLDSTTALSVIESLKQIGATRHSTVVMTIHQPSARLFNLIDKIMFLSSGQITYFGPTAGLLTYAKQIYIEAGKGDFPVENPPELFLDLCDDLKSKGHLELVTTKFKAVPNDSVKDDTSTDPKASVRADATAELDTMPTDFHYANNFFGDIMFLCERNFMNTQRTPELFFARLGSSIFFGVLMGTLFLFSDESATGLQHRVSYFVFTLAFYLYTSLEALPIFLGECEIFQREYSRGAYRASAYTIAATLVTLPFYLIVAVVYCSITWFLVGCGDSPDKFFFFIFTVFTTIMAGSNFATLISTIVPDPMTGQTAGSGLFSVMFLFSGFFIARDQIPDYWIYLHYLSLFKYSYDSMIVSSFAGISYGTVSNEDILHQYAVNGINKGTGVGVLWLFIIAFRVFFYYRLTTSFNGSRK